MAQTGTLLYAFLKPWVRLGALFFFRKLEVRNAEKLPKNKPVILVANHQNAMLDPVITCLFSRKQLHWLTRADVFKIPAVNSLLRKFNMLPVYRERDRVADIAERNKTTFDVCYERLRENAVICIFPEGTHRGKKQLVPLKKGLGRMASGAINDGINDICVVPVGLDYENYYEYRKDLLINFGDPIDINAFATDTANTGAKWQAEFTQLIQTRLTAQMINIHNDDVYHEIMVLKPLCDKISKGKRLGEKFDFFKSVSAELDATPRHHPFLIHEVNVYKNSMHRLGISEEYFDEKLSIWKFIGAFLLLPLACIGLLLFFPLFSLTENFVKNKIKDPLFKNSIRLCFWTFLTPFWILLLFAIFFWVYNSASVAVEAVAIGLLCAWVVLIWRDWWKSTMQFMKCSGLKKEQNKEYLDWLSLRKKISNWIIDINQKQKHVQTH